MRQGFSNPTRETSGTYFEGLFRLQPRMPGLESTEFNARVREESLLSGKVFNFARAEDRALY